MAKIDSRLHSLQHGKLTNLSDVLTYHGIANTFLDLDFIQNHFPERFFFYGQQLAHDKNENTQTG